MPAGKINLTAALLIGVGLCNGISSATAAEGGHGDYLLGLKGQAMGVLPGPGVYFSDNTYFYNASATAGRLFPTEGGQVVAGLKADAWVNLPSLLWSTPVEILGGNLAFAALIPFGGPRVDATATLTSPFLGAPIPGARSDSVTSYGDPVLSALIGWHSGNFHWSVGVANFLPLGDYRQGALANIANHRLATDINGAITWLDPHIGLDLSAALGITYNQTNTATNYKTGDEFHLEWAATQHLNQQFSIGAVGYYYLQLTGDSGPGATLGPFKGEVVALGGSVGFNFKLGELPISTQLRAYREFDVQNRLEGTAAFLTLSAPLWIQQASARK